ncbi:glycosyltransferase family 2 protein [Lysinibacillus sp. BPa_S21]|uniref:glycosyltransferase family 2 protein n=1 Tax=Lysinibacillus sp. BPa_S21 TaxID=2932478 RepID=UPI002010E4CF|nr:glycosyltransferase family 2 protein [Lysinibacillus sp. BPa_S21]MCL1698245.1 glycosyltransferase family 2 protein [Lysinibacillus sp. BPa_S21]
MDNCFISLCMIVKNEEEFLPECLRCVQEIVDEIIIVDTGSTDASIEIGKNFGGKVISHKWDNNFAKARNISLENATGDWILILDADEFLDSIDRDDFHKYIKESNADILSLELVNYYGDKRDESRTYTMAQSRLFKNHLGLKFENSIHETINLNDVNTDVYKTKHFPIKIHHLGYLTSVTEKKKKNERNMNLLHAEIKNEKHSPWMEYHLASEYYRQKNFDRAFIYCNESIKRFLIAGLMPPSLIYNLKYSILITTESFKEVLKGIDKAILLYPDYVDLYFYKAVALYHEGMVNECILTLEHCLSLGENNLAYLTMSGTGSYQALFYQALCFKRKGNHEMYEKLLLKALEIYPNYKEATDELMGLN